MASNLFTSNRTPSNDLFGYTNSSDEVKFYMNEPIDDKPLNGYPDFTTDNKSDEIEHDFNDDMSLLSHDETKMFIPESQLELAELGLKSIYTERSNNDNPDLHEDERDAIFRELSLSLIHGLAGKPTFNNQSEDMEISGLIILQNLIENPIVSDYIPKEYIDITKDFIEKSAMAVEIGRMAVNSGQQEEGQEILDQINDATRHMMEELGSIAFETIKGKKS